MAISRREALTVLGSAIGVGALASCSPQGSDQKTAASSSAEAPVANVGDDAKAEARLVQARHNVHYNSEQRDPLVLLHFSDIHGNAEALNRALMWAREHADLIDDTLVTGDLVDKVFSDGMEFWNRVEGANRVLTCIGNHDAYDTMETPRKSYDMVSVADVASQFIDAYCGSWGNIDHVAGTTWYAKDYPERGVRLVVLDCMLYIGVHSKEEADAQDAWLASTLADAAKQGLAVVVAEHFPLAKDSTVDCSWAPFDRKVGVKNFLDARVTNRIQSFIDGGGSFACYLCGHTHSDAAQTLPDHPEQFALNVACASDDPKETKWGDMDRSQESTRDALNVVFVDTANELVKVVRVGADRDLALQHRGTLCWNYRAHRLVYAD